MTTKRLFMLLLAALMAVIAACGKINPNPQQTSQTTLETTSPDTEMPSPAAETPSAEAAKNRPLITASDGINGKFSPFTAESAPDIAIVNMVLGNYLIMHDRLGELVYNGLEGETRSYNGTDYYYNGLADGEVTRDEDADTTTYHFKLRQGVKYSDGREMNIDDVIFTIYAYMDPSYAGGSALHYIPIHGLKEYCQAYDNTASTFQDTLEVIREAGADGDAESYKYTRDMFNDYWDGYNANYRASIDAIISLINSNYASSVEDIKPGATDLETNRGLQIALGMYGWGFADPSDSGGIVDTAGNSYDLISKYPTIEDYITAVNTKYTDGYKGASDACEFDDVPGAKTYDKFLFEMVNKLLTAKPDSIKRTVSNISGINRINDYEMEVTTDGFDVHAVYHIFQLYPVPMYYYGDASKYDYTNDMFGFDYGDTSFLSKAETMPMGAGPYKFVKYEDKTVYLEANENYWKGTPLIKEVQFNETDEAESIQAMQTGTVDISNVAIDVELADQIKQINGGELNGDVITYIPIKFLGYGFIGLNAKNVSVNSERSSEASKDLRKGIATIFAVFRDISVSSYYDGLANVINYPMSETSWASPQHTDPCYSTAYSKDVNGDEIYSPSMTEAEKEYAAKQAALGYFEAAGFTIANGKVIAAPDGGKTEFDAWITAGGSGDHPSYLILTKSKEMLSSIGITLNIHDLTAQAANNMWDGLNNETVDIWCAGYQAALDPDIYQRYHSDGLVSGGTGSNFYGLDDKALDEVIIASDLVIEGEERKVLFLNAFNTILDEGVEVPVYQRNNCMLFSSQRIDISTLPGDMTTYYGYDMGIEKISLR